jgi:hypothetical protein
MSLWQFFSGISISCLRPAELLDRLRKGDEQMTALLAKLDELQWRRRFHLKALERKAPDLFAACGQYPDPIAKIVAQQTAAAALELPAPPPKPTTAEGCDA